MDKRTFDRTVWGLLLAFGVVVPVLYFRWWMPVTPVSGDPSLFERGLGTPLLLWLNGRLGTFLNFRFLGSLSWTAIPLLVLAVVRWKQILPWQRALALFTILGVLVIGVFGGFNYRYALTFEPLFVVALFLFLHQAFEQFGHTLVQRRRYVLVLVGIAVLNTALAIDLRQRTKAANATFSSPDTEGGSLKERLDSSPQDLEGWLKGMGVAATDTVLVNNLPVWYYRTERPGIYYWCGSDQLFLEGGTPFLFHDRTDAEVATFLRDSLHCRYIFSTKELSTFAPRFQTFLEERCTLLGTEHRDHTLHRIDTR